MSSFLRFARLSPGERHLLIRAVVLVAMIRLALSVMPFRYLLRLLHIGQQASSRDTMRDAGPAARLAWAVRATARFVPGASCLTQSLALHCLLRRAGHPSEIHIGVKKIAPSGLEAHAWVEHAGRTWLAAPEEVARYSRIVSFVGPHT